jgi:DNA-binding NarL/FixJ family response regulator
VLTDDAPILIVNDDNLVCLGIRMTLEDAAFRNIQVARTRSAAIKMVLRHRPAVVLMDVRLGSGMDGVEAAQKSRLWINATAPPACCHGSACVLNKPILSLLLIGAILSLPRSARR